MKSVSALARAAALPVPLPSMAADEIRDCDGCPVPVVVLPGAFTMGSDDVESSHPDGMPAHRVTIGRAFAIGTFDITFEPWDACVANGGCPPMADERIGDAAHAR